MEQDTTSIQEASCAKTNKPEELGKLWTIEYNCRTYRGIAIVRAHTVEEARMLFLNGSNFNGEKNTIQVTRITQINPETPQGIVVEYYVDIVPIQGY